MIVIGLTGGIASGKSTVSNILKVHGITIIDADKISREIVSPNSPALIEITKEFGSDILNESGVLNRKKLGAIVFNDNAKLSSLNNITHPYIREKIVQKILYFTNKGETMCVLDAAILIEGKFTDLVDYIILVYVNEVEQIERIINRDKISYGDAISRITAQMSFEEKKQFADYIIDNTGSVENTSIIANKIIKEIILLEETNA